jgi:predicted DNA-binding transcriptional regulator YafY
MEWELWLMRADRLLSILLLLQVHRRLTARELSRRLEVSERTIHRDMLALSIVGVPVTAVRGTGGGWRLLEAYQTNLTGLSEAEIQALFLTTPTRLLSDLGLHRASEAALIKLVAAIPSVLRNGAEDMRARIHVDIAGWHQTHEPVPCLRTLQDAVWQGRKLRFTYPRGEVSVERVVDPLGLVAKGNAWYLVAAVDGEPRSYRVSRIRDAVALDQLCQRPPKFDLAGYWEKSSAEFQANLPRYLATLRFSPDETNRIASVSIYAQVELEDAPDGDGSVTRVMRFDSERAACAFVLGFAGKVEVLQPQALRERVLWAARSVLSADAAHDAR